MKSKKSHEIPLGPIVFPMNSIRHPSGSPPSKVLKAQAAAPTGLVTPGRWRCLATVRGGSHGLSPKGNNHGESKRRTHVTYACDSMCMYIYIFTYAYLCLYTLISRIYIILVYVYMCVCHYIYICRTKRIYNQQDVRDSNEIRTDIVH